MPWASDASAGQGPFVNGGPVPKSQKKERSFKFIAAYCSKPSRDDRGSRESERDAGDLFTQVPLVSVVTARPRGGVKRKRV